MMNITLLAAQAALADTLAGGNPTLTPVSGEAQMNLWDMAVKGGWIMLVLALLSVACFYIFFERLDPLAIIILMTTCFFKICVYFYAGTSLINGVFKKINHKIISLPILVVMCLCGAHFQESQVENLNQILNVNPTYLLPIFELAIPVLVWIISEIKYHKHPIEKSETN